MRRLIAALVAAPILFTAGTAFACAPTTPPKGSVAPSPSASPTKGSPSSTSTAVKLTPTSSASKTPVPSASKTRTSHTPPAASTSTSPSPSSSQPTTKTPPPTKSPVPSSSASSTSPVSITSSTSMSMPSPTTSAPTRQQVIPATISVDVICGQLTVKVINPNPSPIPFLILDFNGWLSFPPGSAFVAAPGTTVKTVALVAATRTGTTDQVELREGALLNTVRSVDVPWDCSSTVITTSSAPASGGPVVSSAATPVAASTPVQTPTSALVLTGADLATTGSNTTDALWLALGCLGFGAGLLFMTHRAGRRNH